MKTFKKALSYIGVGCLLLVICGAAVVILRALYINAALSLITLIFCPFIACYFIYGEDQILEKKKLNLVLSCVLILSVCCSFCIMSGKSKPMIYVEKLFLKGQTKHHEVFVKTEEGYEGYETQYYYELAPGEPAFVVEIIDWALIILSLGIPVLLYFIFKGANSGKYHKKPIQA